MQWHDYRLAVDKTDHGTFVPLQGNKFWKPDIYFPHGRQGQLQKIPENTEGAHLYLNGTVVYFQRYLLFLLLLLLLSNSLNVMRMSVDCDDIDGSFIHLLK